MSDVLVTIGDCDARVRAAEAAIAQLHLKRCRDSDTGWHYPVTPKVRAKMPGLLLVRPRALRRKDEIERGCS
jgi:hypothetical protein